jgi:hypothetical protein
VQLAFNGRHCHGRPEARRRRCGGTEGERSDREQRGRDELGGDRLKGACEAGQSYRPSAHDGDDFGTHSHGQVEPYEPADHRQRLKQHRVWDTVLGERGDDL